MATEPRTAVIPLRLSVAPFDRWAYQDVAREMRAKKPKNFEVLKSYAVDKDHYRAGKEWIGPGVALSTGKIEQQFAPEDATGEVLSNVSNAFTEPQIGGAPLEDLPEGQPVPTEVQSRIQEGLSLLSAWWDKRRLQELIQDRQSTGAWAGFAGIRAWIPWRFLLRQQDGTVTIQDTDSFEEALDFIHVAGPSPDVGAILVDPGTMDRCAVFMDDEIVYDNQGRKRTYKRAELIYLDPTRSNDAEAQTIVRIVYADKERQPIRAPLPLGGRLLFTDMNVRSLLTDPVIRTQRQLNLLASIITRLGETAAFPERYTLNAKPQGTRIPYEEGETLASGAFLERDEEGHLWAIIPEERTLGAATTTELVGLDQYDDKGDKKGQQMPNVIRFDPVDPKPYIEAADAARRRILRMCAQGHLGGISNAEASGIAYEQARAVFEKDLNARRVAEEGMLRELLTAVLRLAEVIVGREGYFTDVMRVTVDQRIDAGPRSPDLVRLDLEAYEKGVMSWETTAAKIGIEDIDAERVRVRRSAAHILEILEKATASAETFTPESLIEVLRKLNIPEEIVSSLVAKEEPTPPQPGTPAPEE